MYYMLYNSYYDYHLNECDHVMLFELNEKNERERKATIRILKEKVIKAVSSTIILLSDKQNMKPIYNYLRFSRKG